VTPSVTGPEARAEVGVEGVTEAGVDVVEPVVMAKTVVDNESTPRRRISSARAKVTASTMVGKGERARS
jgi:hypothetical protein